MYIAALCVCLLQICQLTCVLVEEARRVFTSLLLSSSSFYVVSTDNNGSCDVKSLGRSNLNIQTVLATHTIILYVVECRQGGWGSGFM